jgi:hypothetical protein
MYFRFNLLIYQFAKKNVKKMINQTNKKINSVMYLRTKVVVVN